MAEQVGIVFRVDSGAAIGTGHLVRCLTLASELRQRGAQVTFVGRQHPGHALARVRSEFECIALPANTAKVPAADDYSSWLGVEPAQDAEETMTAFARRPVDWVVVDHYALGEEWERAVRSGATHILAIDDLALRRHDCDVLLDQNYVGERTPLRYVGLTGNACTCLLGARYALLQREYVTRVATDWSRYPPRRVLVYFGGADPTNETAKAIEALSSAALSHLELDVVLGANYLDPEAIRARLKARGTATLHDELATLADVMARADVAVGATGATTWERLALGIPTVVVTVAANQVPVAEALARDGYVSWIGAAADSSVAAYEHALTRICREPPLSLPPLVDGRGAQRVAEVMLPSPIASLGIRRATPSDAAIVLDWRNEPVARAMSFSSEPIRWHSHLQWFQAKLLDPQCEVWVVEAAGLPVGQFRLDHQDDETTLSYALDPIVRGRGWGTWLVSRAMARAANSATRMLRAEVRSGNDASCRIFNRLGFAEHRTADKSLFEWRVTATHAEQG